MPAYKLFDTMLYCCIAQATNISEKIVVDLYYEVLCPDSRNFLLYQVTAG
jgi:hypothetical protein